VLSTVNTRIKELIKNSTWKGISSPLHTASMDQRRRGKNRAATSRVENRGAENKAGKIRPSREGRGQEEGEKRHTGKQSVSWTP